MNINDFKQYRNGIKLLSTESFYCEDLFVVNQSPYQQSSTHFSTHTSIQQSILTLLSNQYENDIIRAIPDDINPSFSYQGKNYKIIQRTRFLDNQILIDTGFDFQNTIQNQKIGFIEIRQVGLNEKPNEPLIDFPKLCQGVIIQSNSLKIVNDGQFLKNVVLKGNEIVISCDLQDVNIKGNQIYIGNNCKNIIIEGNDIVVSQFSQSVFIGNDSQQIIIGQQCKNVQIKNVCRNIQIEDQCQNIIIQNQCQDIKIHRFCGINGSINIGSNVKSLQIGEQCANFGQIIIGDECGKTGSIIIGNHCGSDNGLINIYHKCNGKIIIEDQCGFNFGQLTIQSLCENIKIHQYTGSGNDGKVFISSNCKNIDIDIGNNQSLQMSQNIKKCTLTKTDEFDAANFLYVIKKSVETDILKINEYKTIGSIKDDEKIDMFDTFKPNENFKVRM